MTPEDAIGLLQLYYQRNDRNPDLIAMADQWAAARRDFFGSTPVNPDPVTNGGETPMT